MVAVAPLCHHARSRPFSRHAEGSPGGGASFPAMPKARKDTENENQTVPAVSKPGEDGSLAGSRFGRGSMIRTRASLERAAVGLKGDLDLVDAQLAQAFKRRLRRRILRHVTPRLAGLVELSLEHRLLSSWNLR